MNDASQTANENETHIHALGLGLGLGKMGHPFHDVDTYQMVVDMSASVQDDFKQ